MSITAICQQGMNHSVNNYRKHRKALELPDAPYKFSVLTHYRYYL